MALYKRLRDLKEDHDLTQKQVADLIGVSMNHYGKYERGENDLPLEKAVILADFYDVSLDYIAGRSIHRHGNAAPEFTADEIELIDRFRSLGERDKGKAEMYVQMLSEQSAAALSSKGAV
ncbi:MAG: helix-turn-helix transcriptional regulator [Oscillospiraceae bacterium]|nr:helix-turn-helix transcriptional regulator [Oscillospiraceae bacterium]